MVSTIQLLGAPMILHDDVAVAPPRGRKAWAVLAYLLLCERPVTRSELGELLFADAADPRGALRWNLAQLRQALGAAAVLHGDPVQLVLAVDVVIDIRDSGSVGGVLLEGMEFATSPAFDSWLLVTRRRYAGRTEAVLRDTALAELAAGRPDRAVELATRLVALDPFDEGHHELLVRGLACSGDRAGALAQVAACRRLFRGELGCEPSPAVLQAAGPGGDGEAVVGDRVAARGHLESGEAAVAAGALEHGLRCLRLARAEAAACGDRVLHARSLVALGTALVHAVRGRDEEGAAVLHEALAVAEAAGHRETLLAALRELAYTDIQAGRRASVEHRLTRAEELADSDAEHAAILAVQGMNRSDMGDYAGAFTSLLGALERAERCGDSRQTAVSLTLIARAQLLRGETSEAMCALDRALGHVEAERWLSFRPFPETMRGEVDLQRGDMARAPERFERAFALACELQDPCWEGLAARNLGLLHRARGQLGSSREWIDQARTRCTRLPDRYVWMHGHILDTAITFNLEGAEREQTHKLIRALGALAARTEMRELVVRGLVHAARIGQAGALDSARTLAVAIDNPTLAPLFAGAS